MLERDGMRTYATLSLQLAEEDQEGARPRGQDGAGQRQRGAYTLIHKLEQQRCAELAKYCRNSLVC